LADWLLAVSSSFANAAIYFHHKDLNTDFVAVTAVVPGAAVISPPPPLVIFSQVAASRF
jgi:hypothetical protein